MQLLSEKIQKHKGKKIYGYLDKNTKALVKDIVKLLGADEQISELYDAWYHYKCEIVRTYTDASFTLDTYTHVTSDMQKSASAIVGNMMQKIMIKE